VIAESAKEAETAKILCCAFQGAIAI